MGGTQLDKLINTALNMVLKEQGDRANNISPQALARATPLDILSIVNGFHTCAPIISALATTPNHQADEALQQLLEEIRQLSEQVIPKLRQEDQSKDFIHKALIVRGLIIHLVTQQYQAKHTEKLDLENAKKLLETLLFEPSLHSVFTTETAASDEKELFSLQLKLIIGALLLTSSTDPTTTRLNIYEKHCVAPLVKMMNDVYQNSTQTLTLNRFFEVLLKPIGDIVQSTFQQYFTENASSSITESDLVICHRTVVKVQDLLAIFGQMEEPSK